MDKDNGKETVTVEDIKSMLVDVDMNNNPNGLLTDVSFVRSSGHVKRPMNPFMVWSQYQRKMICREHPSIHNAQISKQLGLLWKSMTYEERLPYKIEADRLVNLHRAAHPNYKYQPKKKSAREKLAAAARNPYRYDRAIAEEVAASVPPPAQKGKTSAKGAAGRAKPKAKPARRSRTSAGGRGRSGRQARAKSVATNFVAVLNTETLSPTNNSGGGGDGDMTGNNSNIYTTVLNSSTNERCLDGLTLSIPSALTSLPRNVDFSTGNLKVSLNKSMPLFNSAANFGYSAEIPAGHCSPVNSDYSSGTLDTEVSSVTTNCSTGSVTTNKHNDFRFINVSKAQITAGVNYLINDAGLLMPSSAQSSGGFGSAVDEFGTAGIDQDGPSPSLHLPLPTMGIDQPNDNLGGVCKRNSDGLASSPSSSILDFGFADSPVSSINAYDLDALIDFESMHNYNGDPFMSLDQLDVGSSDLGSHFEFPNFDEPEVMNIFFSNEMK